VHVSWYRSTDKHCIVLPVKFEDGLSISDLRKKVILSKIMHLKFSKNTHRSSYPDARRPLEKGQTISSPWKKSHYT
jgi:hypothetical protein